MKIKGLLTDRQYLTLSLLAATFVFCGYVSTQPGTIFGNRSGWTERQSKPFDTLIVFMKEFFEKVNFEKKAADDNKCMNKLPSMQTVNSLHAG